MTTTAFAPPAKPRPRPFVPVARTAPPRRITSGRSKALLVGTLALAYVLQFGLAVVTAIAIFVIRQDGELEEQATSSLVYLITVVLFGLVPVALSLGVVLLYRWRAGWTWSELGITRLPRTPFERRLWWRSSITYLAALIVSGFLMAALSWLRGSGGYPSVDGAEVGRVLAILPEALMAGLGEELLLVAFLVVAMEKLGARAPLIYVVAVTLRIAFHVYYGPAVLGLVLWAVAAVWLFRRTRLVWPLVIVHTLWDVNALSAEFVPVLSGIVFVGAIITVITVGIVHLATRNRPDPHPAGTPPLMTPSLPPPGWYPWSADPYAPPLLRWWTGTEWTPHTAPLP